MNKDLVKVMKALDDEDKLRIINHIYSHGKKSITDIRKDMNYNFSTAHKYLNEMENAGLLSSEKVSENGRMKKLYSIKNFNINISPESISGMKEEDNEDEMKKIMIITTEGKVIPFDPNLLKKIFISSGVPIPLIEPLMKRVDEGVHTGITVEDLKDDIFEKIDSQIKSLNLVKEKVEKNELFYGTKNLMAILREGNYNDVIKSYKIGDYQVRNLHDFYPINIQHNPLKILKYGLKILGLDTNPAKHFASAISHIIASVEASGHNITDTQHAFDAFNVYLAPYALKLPKKVIEQELQGFIYRLNLAYGVDKTIALFALEQSVPSFMKKMETPMGGVYGDYEAESKIIYDLIIKLIEKEKKDYPKFLVKIRNSKELPPETVLDKVYISNLIPKWQNPNVTYMLDWCRVDSSWAGAKSSFGTLQEQSAVLNLPRAALIAKKDEDKAFEWIHDKIEELKKVFLLSAQNTYSQAFTDMPYLSTRIKDGNKLVKYSDFGNSIYPVELMGLYEFTKIMTGENNHKFSLSVIKEIDNQLAELTQLRTGVMSLDFLVLAKRFTESNNNMFKINHETYLGGIGGPSQSDEEKLLLESKYHQHLKAGHCLIVNKLNTELLQKALKTDIGFMSQRSNAYLV